MFLFCFKIGNDPLLLFYPLSRSSWFVSKAQDKYQVSLFFSLASLSYFSSVLCQPFLSKHDLSSNGWLPGIDMPNEYHIYVFFFRSTWGYDHRFRFSDFPLSPSFPWPLSSGGPESPKELPLARLHLLLLCSHDSSKTISTSPFSTTGSESSMVTAELEPSRHNNCSSLECSTGAPRPSLLPWGLPAPVQVS